MTKELMLKSENVEKSEVVFSKTDIFELFYSKCLCKRNRRIQNKCKTECKMPSQSPRPTQIDNLELILERDEIEVLSRKKSTGEKQRRCPRRKKANVLHLEIRQ